jgi:hypothetical protein
MSEEPIRKLRTSETARSTVLGSLAECPEFINSTLALKLGQSEWSRKVCYFLPGLRFALIARPRAFLSPFLTTENLAVLRVVPSVQAACQ